MVIICNSMHLYFFDNSNQGVLLISYLVNGVVIISVDASSNILALLVNCSLKGLLNFNLIFFYFGKLML